MEFQIDCFYHLLGILSRTKLILGVVVFVAFYYWYRKPPGFPCGPRGIPVLGVVPFVGKFPARTLRDWSKRYGPIMSVRLGTKDVVVLNDFDSIQEAFVKNKDVFSNRLFCPPELEVSKGILLCHYNPRLRALRKFATSGLRGYGVGKKSMEERIQEEVAYLNDAIRSNEGKAFDISHILSNAVSNNICSVIFGQRFNYDDRLFQSIIAAMDKRSAEPDIERALKMILLLPQLRFIPPMPQKIKKLVKKNNKLHGFIQEIVDSHQKTFDPDHLRDIMDCYLVEMKNGKEYFTEETLLHYIRELFVGGTETTTGVLCWGILCLLHWPEEQRKLHDEISKVLGHDGVVSMSHRSELCYSQAFIEEIYRYRTLLPFAIYHATSDDTTFKGFFIPKGTQVMPNIWAVHNDPEIFNQPERFNPERHLDAQRRFVKSHHVIPFSMGPRHCLGEQLAKMEVFMFLVSLVQKFEFLPDPLAEELPDIENGSGAIGFLPLPFKVVTRER